MQYLYEVYLKMAQNCFDRDRATWLDMHSNFKMAQKFSLSFRAILKFEFQNGPKLQNGDLQIGFTYPIFSVFVKSS